jgi:selenocysteine lyase/cysteine desulfurase
MAAYLNLNIDLIPYIFKPLPYILMMPMGWLEDLRSRIEITSKMIYFDNAGAGPLSRDVIESIRSFLELWSGEGEPWDEALDHIVDARREFASLVGADYRYVAAVPGVTYGLNSLLSSLKIRPGSNAVVSPLNFPTGIISLQAMRSAGLLREVRLVRPRGGYVPLEEYERLIDDSTAIVLVDHVSWITGYRERVREISEIAHRRGAIVIVDAFHSVGIIEVDVEREGIDALLCGSYKWLMGPHGAGFVYVSNQLLEDLEPRFSGWMGIEDSVLARKHRGERLFERPFNIEEFNPARDATKLEWGTWPVIAFEGVLASMRLLKKFEAPHRYSTHTSKLVERLVEGLEELGLRITTPLDRYAAIITFEYRDPYALAEKLRREGIVVSPRPGIIRVSPHVYNTIEEVEAFIETVKRYIKNIQDFRCS